MMKRRSKKSPILISLVVAGLLFLIFTNFLVPHKDISYKISIAPSPKDERFSKEIGDLLHPAFVAGNKIEPFYNGDEIFPSMLAAIKSAQHNITFESFIYWSGDIGKQFAQSLAERASHGVKVHVLLDWAGSGKISDEIMETMTKAGVEVERYHKPRWTNITRMNNRTHRKTLVVDGKIGFTGGVGIADEWTGKGLDPKHWRDTHYRVEGPVVNQMQSSFMDNWLKTRPEVHTDETYYPVIPPKGNSLAQMFVSSAGEGGSNVRIMYLMAIAGAKESIYLESAYFVPDDHVKDQLIAAKKRGVDVKIIVPGEHNDSDVTDQASKELWGELLKAGVRIFQYQPALFHCKVLIVDHLLVSVGSTNFDQRSFRINDEANLNVLDKEFADSQIKAFERDLGLSKEVSFEQWSNRPLQEKVMAKMASLFSSQL